MPHETPNLPPEVPPEPFTQNSEGPEDSVPREATHETVGTVGDSSGKPKWGSVSIPTPVSTQSPEESYSPEADYEAVGLTDALGAVDVVDDLRGPHQRAFWNPQTN